MQRRDLIRGLVLTGVGLSIPMKRLLANTSLLQAKSSLPFHQFKLGNLDLMVLTDGHVELGPVNQVFPNGNAEAEKTILRRNFRSEEAVDLGMNMLIVKKEQEVILIDTGTGGAFGPASGWLLNSMKDANIQPESITRIIISHAHPDHIGGVLSKDGVLNFPNAQVYIAKAEYEFWMADKQDFSKSKFGDKKLLEVFTASAQKALKTLGNKLHQFNDGEELFGCVRVQLAPGHTPGHTLVHIFSGNEEIVHIADLIHSDVLLFPHPEWGFNGDTDINLAAVTRKRILGELMKGEKKVFAYHLPWPGIGHVRAQGTAYEWIPEAYAIPG